MSIKCPKCGLVRFAKVKSCGRCKKYPVVKLLIEEDQPKESSRKKLAVFVIIATLFVAVFLFVAGTPRNDDVAAAASASTPVKIPAAKQRSMFAEQIRDKTDSLAAQLFNLSRDAELQRLTAQAEAVTKQMHDLDEDKSISDADKARALTSLKPEMAELQDEMDSLRQVARGSVKPEAVGQDSDTLFYHVTGALGREVSRELIKWWHDRSAEQQQIAGDLQRLGFKGIVIGNSVNDGQHLSLGDVDPKIAAIQNSPNNQSH